MQNLAWIVLGYGALIFAGGVIGFRNAGSRASLLSGSFSGVALLLCAVAIWQEHKLGVNIAAGVSLALFVIMGLRFLRSRKFMPAGFVTVLSAVVAAVLLAAIFR